MSRCVLDNEETGHEVVIGWDPGLNTFFIQVTKFGMDDPTLWLGTRPGEFSSPEGLIAAVIPYACKCNRDVLVSNLYLDQQNNSERIYSIDGDQVW